MGREIVGIKGGGNAVHGLLRWNEGEWATRVGERSIKLLEIDEAYWHVMDGEKGVAAAVVKVVVVVVVVLISTSIIKPNLK